MNRKDRAIGTRGRASVAVVLLLGAFAVRAYDIAGVVTDLSDGRALAGVTVEASASCPGCNVDASDVTDADGQYCMTLPSIGWFYVRTRNTHGYLDELHRDVRCFDERCHFAGGSSLAAISAPSYDAETAYVDFELERYATLSVAVVDAESGGALHPLARQAQVRIFHLDGSSAQGHGLMLASEATALRLLPGAYRIAASAEMYATTLYPSEPCDDPCSYRGGELVELEGGETQEAVIRLVRRYGTIRGRVTDAPSQAPLAGVRVSASSMYPENSATTDGDGRYALVVPSRPMTLATLGTATHARHTLAPIIVASGAVHEGADFELQRKGWIAGVVRRRDGSPVAAARVSAGGSVFTADDQGRYRGALVAGSHRVSATGTGLVTHAYPGQYCPGSCDARGTAVVVHSDRTTEGIDFSLEPGGMFVGSFWTNDPPHRSLSGALGVYSDAGGHIVTSIVSAYGGFETPMLPYGRYRLVASAVGYAAAAYRHRRCVAGIECALLAEPLELSASATIVDASFPMQRPPRGRVTVRATDAITGESLEAVDYDDPELAGVVQRGFFATAFLREGVAVALTGLSCVSTEIEQTCDVPEGDYRVNVYAHGYVDLRHPGVPCESNTCNASAGAPVAVRAPTPVVLHLSFERAGRLRGVARDGRGVPLDVYAVEVFDRSGRAVRTLLSATSWEPERRFVPNYVGELSAGEYFVRTRNVLGYTDRLFDGIACSNGACDPRLGTPVTVDPHVATTIDFNLGTSELLLRSGFE